MSTTAQTTPAPAPVNAAKAAIMAANTVWPISQLLDYIVANPTGFFKIVEKEPPKGGAKPAAAKPGASTVKYYKQQWDFGNGTKFTGNLKFNLMGNAPTEDEIPATVHEGSRPDILAGKVRMYRGIGNVDDPTDHRNSYDKGDGKNNINGLFKVSVSTAEAGKLGQFMNLLDVQWNAECERIKNTDKTKTKFGVNNLTSTYIASGERAGTEKDAPTFGIKIPINETWSTAFKSRAGQPKSIILDASTRYPAPNGNGSRFLKAAIDTPEGQVAVDATNAWQFVEGGSKFVGESEFEFNDPNCSGFGFAMALNATVPVIERRENLYQTSSSNLIGNEDDYLAAMNGTAPEAPAAQTSVSVCAPAASATTATKVATTAAAVATTPGPTPQQSADDAAAMMALLNQFQ